jgi:DNA-binding CsgD family transcriptional regulator
MANVGGVQKLTRRQKEILRLLLDGIDAKSAARHLGISVHTVNEHLREARRHLEVSSSREAARILRQAESTPPKNMRPEMLGIVPPPSIRLRLAQLSPKRRLAFGGVSLVILMTAAVIALSVSDGGNALRAVDTLTDVATQQRGAEAQVPDSYEQREVPISTFDRIEVTGPFNVGVIVGQKTAAEIHLVGPPVMLDDMIARVEGGTLFIRFREGASWSWNPGAGVNLVVFAPKLDSARLNHAGTVEIFGVRGEVFSATTDGSGSITIRDLQTVRVMFTAGGAGGITAEGTAREGTYVVGGPGSIDAKRLAVEAASVAVGGAGSVYADVSGTANVSLTGSGRADIVGGATCIKQPAMSPRIECR